jgi:hypothetical protein
MPSPEVWQMPVFQAVFQPYKGNDFYPENQRKTGYVNIPEIPVK